MKNRFHLLNNYLLYEIVTLSCLFANIIHTHQIVMNLPKWHYIIYPNSHLFFLLLEGFSLYFISFIYPKQRHKLFLLLYLTSTLLLWINVGYSRYFNTYMPLSLYTEYNNLNGLLPNIKDAIELNDFFFLITTIIVLCFYYTTGRNIKPWYGFYLPLFSVFFLLLSFTLHYLSVKKDHDHLAEHFKELNDERTIWDTMFERWQMMENTMPKTCVSYYGIGPSLLFSSLYKISHKKRFRFTEIEKRNIKRYMYTSNYPLPKDTIDNLIFILVESLSSYPIKKSFGGVELTPNINKLLKYSYYNPNMKSQALLGESSDGQFIYLTGLLPLKNGVTINEISSQHITTFVSLIKKHNPTLSSQMIIPTKKDSWSQEAMCKKYGIDTLFSKEDYPISIREDWLNDKQLLEFASKKNSIIKPPFISIVLTSSMHSPYTKSYEEYNINYPSEFSSELKHYLDNVHYMDKYLGIYLESIRKYPWYKHCTIIITADHKPNGPKLNVNFENKFQSLPLIILNAPREYRGKTDSRHISQSTIFPFLLDSYHISSKWKGIGKSLFMPINIAKSPYEIIREENEQIISDYLIDLQYLN